MNFVKNIPNILTLANLAMGCIAIVLFSQSNYTMLNYDPKAGDYTVRFFSEQLVNGTFFVMLAALFDIFDGLVARLVKVESALGKQLDSLCDVVSFGIAPAMLLFQLLKYSWANYQQTTDTPMILLIPVLLIPCAAAYRLAKFNLSNKGTSKINSFEGLPTPAFALACIAMPWSYITTIHQLKNFFYNPFVLYAIIIISALLMVSKLSMHKLSINFKDKRNSFIILSVTLITIVGFFYIAYLILFFSVVVYVCLSLLFYHPSKK